MLIRQIRLWIIAIVTGLCCFYFLIDSYHVKSEKSVERYLSIYEFDTVTYNSGIGNQMFQFLAIIMIAKHLNRTPFLGKTDQRYILKWDLITQWFPNLRNAYVIRDIKVQPSSRWEMVNGFMAWMKYNHLNVLQFHSQN